MIALALSAHAVQPVADAGGSPDFAGGFQLTGTFLDFRGNGLSDIEVTRYVVNGSTVVQDGEPVVTSSRATYVMDDLSAGTYRVCFHDTLGNFYDECWENEATAERADDIVLSGSQVVRTDATLTALGHGGVSGRVTGPAGLQSAGVSGVRVELRNASDPEGSSSFIYGGTAGTNSLGEYYIESVPAGDYEVVFGGNEAGPPSAFSSELYDDAYLEANSTVISVRENEVTTGIDAALEPVPHITGTIVDEAGQGIPDISVAAYVDGSFLPRGPSLLVQTDEKGFFDLPASQGMARVCYSDVRRVYAMQCWEDASSFREATAFRVPHTGTVSGKDARLVPARKVLVVEVPKITGRPIVNRSLRVDEGSFEPRDAAVKYQWLADGRAIKRATRPVLKLTRVQLGKRVSVRLTLSAAQYNSSRVVTRPTTPVRPGRS